MKRLWLQLNTIIMVFDKSPKGKGIIIVLPLIGNPRRNTYERQLLFIPMIRNTNHSPLRGMGGPSLGEGLGRPTLSYPQPLRGVHRP